MSIKPVLVPDHDAAALRGLMDRFAEATTGPTRQQLAESRAAVAAAQPNLSEGIMDVVKQAFNDNVEAWPMGTSDEQFIKSWADDIRDRTGRDIPAEKLAKLYQDYTQRTPDVMQSHGTTNEESDVAEAGRPDVMRHGGDKTVRVVKKGGKPIGEIGTDSEASPGNGPYYVKLYDGSYDAVGFDSAEEALAELKYAVKQMAEGSLTEFAPSDSGDGGGDDDGFDEDTLRKLAAQWFAGDEDPQVERLLAAAGWEIGQDEGYDDEPGVFVVLAGDDDGRSYISWPAEELRSAMSEGVSEAAAENNPVVNAITRRIMLQRTDLLSKYGPEKIGQAVDEVADFVGDVEEIGSSDVSGWVRHVEQMLGNMSEGRDVPYNDPNLSKAYNLGYQAYKGLKNNPQLAQAAQDRIEADFPQYARMWTRGYHDGERFDQEKNMSEASPTGVFKQGDKVKVHGKYNGTVVGQDGDTYYVQIDGQPGSQAVSAASLANPAAGVFKQGDKVKVHGKYNGTVVGQDGDTYYVQIDGQPGSQAVSAASLANPAATVAESIDPVEQLRADIRRFAR
jgi:hypothetical protein